MTRHTIRISASGRDLYRVTGAVDIFDSPAPIIDAAKAILAAGASPSDELSVTCPDVTVIPQTLAKLAAERRPPRKSDFAAQQSHF